MTGPAPAFRSSPTGGGGPREAWWRGARRPTDLILRQRALAPDTPSPGRPTQRGSRTGRPGLPRERRAASLRRAGAGGPKAQKLANFFQKNCGATIPRKR
ncbi:MAG: hypothetical protein EON56_00705 [Alphaproteobacteria bacterium]|nr:MAG: hypothetical protein EON56_00705 [Alphaproteobacteria bacterium]